MRMSRLLNNSCAELPLSFRTRHGSGKIDEARLCCCVDIVYVDRH